LKLTPSGNWFYCRTSSRTKTKHVDALSRHVHTVTVDQTLSKELVREERQTEGLYHPRGRKT